MDNTKNGYSRKGHGRMGQKEQVKKNKWLMTYTYSW